jgi:hypothetical protein
LLVFTIILKLYKNSRSVCPERSIFSASILAGIISVFATGIFGWGLREDSLTAMFWLLSGMGYGMTKVWADRGVVNKVRNR